MIITRRAPLVHAAHELAEEDVVGDVRGGLVGAGRVRLVVHRQEDAGDRLRQEGEHRGRAERVEPVGALRDLAVEEAAQERAGAGALVEPADDAGDALDRVLLGRRLGGARRRRSGRCGRRSRSSPGRGGPRRSALGARAASCGRPRRVEVLPQPVEVVRRVARREALELRVEREAVADLHPAVLDTRCRSGRAGAPAGRPAPCPGSRRRRRGTGRRTSADGLDVADRAAEVGAAGGDGHVGLRVLALDHLVAVRG